MENSSSTVPESINPVWGQTPQTSTEAEHTEMADPNLLPVAHTSEAVNPTTADCSEPVLKIKQEEAEVEIVEVKEEQAEPPTMELPRIELHQHLVGAGMAIELPVTQQCVQIPSVTETAFMGVDPSTCEWELYSIAIVTIYFSLVYMLMRRRVIITHNSLILPLRAITNTSN